MTSNIGASVLQRLKNKAKQDRSPVMSLVDQYAYTGFLRRLSQTEWNDFFALKGALMMLVLTGKAIRPTKDVDLDGKGVMTLTDLKSAIGQIMMQSLEQDDGLEFFPETLDVLKDRSEVAVGGAKVRLDAKLGSAKVKVNIDIGFENVVTPELKHATLPPQIKDEVPVSLMMYPVETAIAEKFHAMLYHGRANSRLKDFWDIQLFSQLQEMDGATLARAFQLTCSAHNPVSIVPSTQLEALQPSNEDVFSPKWSAFLRKNGLKGGTFSECAEDLRGFLLPVVDHARGEAPNPGIWMPNSGWSEKCAADFSDGVRASL